MRSWAGGWIAGIVLAGCAPRPEPVAPTLTRRHVVYVTIDGVRWQDVFTADGEGKWTLSSSRMPRTLSAVRTQGVAIGGGDARCGTVHTFGAANMSLPGYQELFSARATACLNNKCDGITRPTLLDDASKAGISTASIGSWSVLNEAVTNHSQEIVLSLGTHSWHGPLPAEGSRLERLLEESEQTEPGAGDFGSYRPDALTSAIALEWLTTAWPGVMHVGLGDTDEWGHQNDKGAYLRALREADDFIGDVIDAASDRLVPLTVVVTTDHGRSKAFHSHGVGAPESGRTFLVAFGDGIAKKGETCLGRDVTTLDVAATVRTLIGLPRLEGKDVGRPIEAVLERSASASMIRRARR